MAKTVRAPMPPFRRAKQFMPFDALKGLKEALAAKEKILTPKKILSQERITELNKQLTSLRKGQIVTVVYYCDYEQDYIQITGSVMKVDPYWNTLQIGAIGIDFSEIYEIIIEDPQPLA